MTPNEAKTRKQIRWSGATADDMRAIGEIVERAFALFPDIGVDRMSLSMDLTACHLNGTPLDLRALLAFDEFNFLHDVLGIIRHIDRTTGKLTDCFVPRCSKSCQTSVPAASRSGGAA